MSAFGRSEKLYRIVLLEDDVCDAQLIERNLKELHCSLERIFREEDFEAVLESGWIDLIISDSSLPSFDTFRALDRTRQKLPDLPFIFLSGNDNPLLKAEALERGADAFISKRNLSDLLRVVRSILEKSSR